MMWKRVKGTTENALLRMPFRAAYMFRPGYIQPFHGIRTKTKWYRAFYALMGPLYPVWKLLLPQYVTTTGCARCSRWPSKALLNKCLRTRTLTVFLRMDREMCSSSEPTN